jgi:hypothetical protein
MEFSGNRLIWPEDRVLIAHQLDCGNDRVVAILKDQPSARVPPVDAIELDLANMFSLAA